MSQHVLKKNPQLVNASSFTYRVDILLIVFYFYLYKVLVANVSFTIAVGLYIVIHHTCFMVLVGQRMVNEFVIADQQSRQNEIKSGRYEFV